MTPSGPEDLQSSGSSFLSLFVRFEGVQGSQYPQELHRGSQDLIVAAGQSWNDAVTELREELDLPADQYRLTLHRLRDGRQWRIAKSAWLGIKPEEEVHLVAVPLVQADKKQKDERKPQAPPSKPVSPRSLANSVSRRTSPICEPPRSQEQAVVVPATPSDSMVSDTEDEATPLDEDERVAQVKPAEANGAGREAGHIDAVSVPDDGAQGPDAPVPHIVPLLHSPPPFSSGPSDVLPVPIREIPLSSTSQQSSTSTLYDWRHACRAPSPSPSYHSERSPSTKARLLRDAPHAQASPLPPARFSSPHSIKASSSSFLSTSALPLHSATPVNSASDEFPTPAQQGHTVAGPIDLVSSQPSTDSDTSFRVGLDATGAVNFVPASSPQLSNQVLRSVNGLASYPLWAEPEEELRKREKGKGKAIETNPAFEDEGAEENNVLVARTPFQVKRERWSSPRQLELSSSRLTDKIVSPKKRHPACRLAPRKKRRLSSGVSARADVSTSTVSSDLTRLSSQSRPEDSIPSNLPSALQPPVLPTSSQIPTTTQYPASFPPVTLRPTSERKKSRSSTSSSSANRRKPDPDDDGVANSSHAQRVEIPAFPRSGRACLYLRLPNSPIAPKWANARLRPVFILKYQGGTLSVLFHVFQHIARETGWDVRDLRLRYTDTMTTTTTDDRWSDGQVDAEREKSAWGFDSLLTDFQNLDEWKVREQAFLDVDYVPFSSSRTWMDTE